MEKKYLSCWYISNNKANHLSFLNISSILVEDARTVQCHGEVEGEWGEQGFGKLANIIEGGKLNNWANWEMKFNGKGWKVYLESGFCEQQGGGLGILERKEQYSLEFCKDEFDKIWCSTGQSIL